MAQIGGITGGKLNAPDAAILPSQAFEFEPSYTMGEAGSFGYRMTAGFGRYEVGVSLDNQAEMQNFGTKISMIENTLVLAVGVAYSAGRLPIAVLRTDAGIVQSGGDGVNVAGLTVIVLQHEAVTAMQDPGLAETQW